MRLFITLILFLAASSATLPRLCAAEKSADEPVTILGQAVVDAEAMWRFVSEVNADFPLELARHYYEVGAIYGIRGDIALCQAIIETGWFRFDKGTAVQPHQHNYCGLGVLQRGMKGHSFDTPRDGVTAQIQHLYAYASTSPLPTGEQKLDKRFGLVNRGSALTWEALSGKWAANPRYGSDILRLYERMIASADPAAPAMSASDCEPQASPEPIVIAEEDILQESFGTTPAAIVPSAPDSRHSATPTIEADPDKAPLKDPRVRHRRR